MEATATQTSLATNQQGIGWRLADTAFCLAIALILYLRFFRFPFTPIDPAIGDQSVYLLGAIRMLEGKFIYRDFFQFTTPGTEFLYFALIKLFGQSAILPKLVTMLVGLAYAALGVSISRRFFSDWRVYLGPLLFLTAGFIPTPDATHQVFSSLAILCALALLLKAIDEDRERPLLYLAIGFLCGASSFFTQTRGILAVIAFAIFISVSGPFTKDAPSVPRVQSRNLLIGFAITFMALMGPVLWLAGAHNLWKDLVEFPLTSYRRIPWNDLRSYGTDFPGMSFEPGAIVSLIRWFLIYLINPGIYVLFAATQWRALRAFGKEERKLLLVALTGGALFLSVAYAPMQFRMGVVSMPAMILTAWMLRSKSLLSRLLSLTLTFFAVVTVSVGVLHSQRNSTTTIDTAAGTLAISDPSVTNTASRYQWLKSHTQPGDFLFSPLHPEYYYLFQLRHPGPVPFLTIYDYTTEEQVRETMAGIQRYQVRYIFWPVELQPVSRLAEEAPIEQDHLGPLRNMLRENYRLVHTFSDFDEVWQRKK